MASQGKNRIFKYFIVGLGVIIFLGIGFIVGRESVFCEICAPQDLDFSLFWEAYHKLKNEFVEPEKISDQDIVYGAISGMVKAFGDPYTVFMDPNDTKTFMEDIAGRFEGVGMEIGIKDHVLQVIAPLENTPAQKAGLRPGDKIIKVDGKLTAELSLDEAVNLIRGPKDTFVVLTILREGWETMKNIEIKRGVIEVPSLRWEMLSDDKTGGKKGIAYLKIYQFSEKAGLDFSQASIQMRASGVKKIIIDLRNNPGGYLEVARDIASFFLKKGDLVVIEDLGDNQVEYRARGNNVFSEYPIVVLINKGSASASEILAGALQDNRQILLIGEDSFGKGSVQRLDNLRDGSSLKITTAKWLTPKGRAIAEVGLKPDIKIEMTDEDYEMGRDPQLDKAIEIIKGL